jgi:hypothetical protein
MRPPPHQRREAQRGGEGREGGTGKDDRGRQQAPKDGRRDTAAGGGGGPRTAASARGMEPEQARGLGLRVARAGRRRTPVPCLSPHAKGCSIHAQARWLECPASLSPFCLPHPILLVLLLFVRVSTTTKRSAFLFRPLPRTRELSISRSLIAQECAGPSCCYAQCCWPCRSVSFVQRSATSAND